MYLREWTSDPGRVASFSNAGSAQVCLLANSLIHRVSLNPQYLEHHPRTARHSVSIKDIL